MSPSFFHDQTTRSVAMAVFVGAGIQAFCLGLEVFEGIGILRFFTQLLNLYNFLWICLLVLFVCRQLSLRKAYKIATISLIVSLACGPVFQNQQLIIKSGRDYSNQKSSITKMQKARTVDELKAAMKQIQNHQDLRFSGAEPDLKLNIRFHYFPEAFLKFLHESLRNKYDFRINIYFLTNSPNEIFCLDQEGTLPLTSFWEKGRVSDFLKSKSFIVHRCKITNKLNKQEEYIDINLRNIKRHPLPYRNDGFEIKGKQTFLQNKDGAFYVTFEFLDKFSNTIKVFF